MVEFSNIEEVVEDLKQGKAIVLVDEEDRENEGDLVVAAEKVTPELINLMVKDCRGLICLAMDGETCDRLSLHPQTMDNTTRLGTAFTVSIDAREGITTGISAADRSHTIRTAVADGAKPGDLARPGHIFPLRAMEGGTLVREGQTEGSVDLMKIAGMKPAGVICEIMKDDGTMARVPDLLEFCQEHDMKITSVARIIEYRLRRERTIKRIQAINLPTDYGEFRLFGYESPGSTEPHLALCKGGIGEHDENGKVVEQEDPILIRVHSECMTGDLFHSQRCECGYQLITAMKKIQKEGRGALIYLRQEGRGIGLANKLHAYKLQEEGYDTVDANIQLGFLADKRDYGLGAQICRDLGLKNVRILTNNPKKTDRLKYYGITVTEQMPLIAAPGEHNLEYLRVKKRRFGHILDEDL